MIPIKLIGHIIQEYLLIPVWLSDFHRTSSEDDANYVCKALSGEFYDPIILEMETSTESLTMKNMPINFESGDN